MNRIHQLPQKLISQIAAGEVVERPASAVKELVENALDAGATRISIEVEGGGLNKIRVVDNGQGMSAEDTRLAFTRHATSKISSLEDLLTLKSLGFRGEALASIASIARVTLKTRQADQRLGTFIELDAGHESAFEETACEQGSDFSVYGLFQHTPARKKYMKSEGTEYGHIFDLLCSTALAHPQIAFRLKKDGVLVFDLPAGQVLKERIRALFGNSTANALLPLTYSQSNLVIGGFVGKPELAQRSKKYQFIFINGRCIENRLLSHAVKEAFHSLLMHEKHPWFLLDIQMDPSMVDSNVHPRKLEVQFVNSQEMYRCAFGAVKHALETSMLSPTLNTPTMPLTESLLERATERFPAPIRSFSPEQQSASFDVKGLRLRPLAQVANSYIVAESSEGLVLIDQHAAHERVRYERLMKAMRTAETIKQTLLTPLELDLGVDSRRLIQEHEADFKALGFEFEAFGGSSYVVRSVPAGLERREPERVILEILTDLGQEWQQSAVHGLRERLLTTVACRGAIKFGDPLTQLEMEALLNDMEQTENASHCPHGRPALLTFQFDRLESMFKRRNF